MRRAQSEGDLVVTLDSTAAAIEIKRLSGEHLPELSEVLPSALGGSRGAVVVYVTHYRAVADSILDSIAGDRPDDSEDTMGGRLLGSYGSGKSAVALRLLEANAAEAPFSRWVEAEGLERGIGLQILARIRELIGGIEPLPLPRDVGPAFTDLDPADVDRFLRLVAREVSGSRPALRRISEVFDLSATELGRLFGVSRQAATKWLGDGEPVERRAKVVAVAALADLLDRRLKADRIPGVVRRPADAYGGETMLDLIRADRHEWLLGRTEQSFDYSQTA